MLTITTILNPLTGGSTTDTYAWEKGKPLSHYVPYGGECVVCCDGVGVDKPLSEIYPARKEHYVVLPVPEGVDRQTWRILGFSAMFAASFIPGVGPFISFVGSNLINLFLRDKDKDQSTSQSYGWQNTSSLTAAHGLVMPVVYGKARMRPVVKNRYVKVDGDKQYLYALYGVTGHGVKTRTVRMWQAGTPYRIGDEVWVPPGSGDGVEPGKTYRCVKDHVQITPTTFTYDDKYWVTGHGTAAFADGGVFVNSRAIGDFGDDVDWETRPGLAEQQVIVGFDATYANTAYTSELYTDCVAVVRDVALIHRSTSQLPPRLSNNYHTLMLHGIAYEIKPPTTIVAFDSTYKYVYFNPTVKTDGYFTSAALLSGDNHLVATFESSANIPPACESYIPTASSEWYRPSPLLRDAHNIEVAFEFPQGLYGQPVGADIKEATARLFVQYREYDPTDKGKWYDFTFDPLSAGKNDYYSDATGMRVRHIVRKKAEPFFVTAKAVNEQLGALDTTKAYEVRMTAVSPCMVRLVNVATVVYGEEDANGDRPGFSYPGEALLGIKALASGQISSDLDVQVDVERDEVWVYDEGEAMWVQKAATNHAWAVYDILVQGSVDHPTYPTLGNAEAEAVYGCGISHTRIDYSAFEAWADNVDAIGYELNIVFDTPMKAWDAILRICQEGRAMIFPSGAKISVFVDKAGSVSQIFTMGNIQVDTFVQKFVGNKDKANMIEATYYDEENGYAKTVLAARTSTWDSTDVFNDPTSVTLYGTTSFEQAMAQAWFLLRSNELLNHVISFGVDVDALAVRAGDVVGVQHDVLTAGATATRRSGRLTNVVHNFLRNGDFESALAPNWVTWGAPVFAARSTDQAKYGTYSLHTRDNVSTNGGSQQTFVVEPNTQYTLSCWIYMLNVHTATATIRAMTRATGQPYVAGRADKTKLNQWQQVSVTLTTGATQTSATVWLGGIGEAYFDGVMFDRGATVKEFRAGTLVTLDKTPPDVVGQVYEMEMRCGSDDGVEVKRGITAGNISGNNVTFGEVWTWTHVPRQYDPYLFGLVDGAYDTYRVASIGRTNELMRTLTLVQYDGGIYDTWTPGSGLPFTVSKTAVGPAASVINPASNVQLSELVSMNDVTGAPKSSILATWDGEDNNPRGTWKVYVRDVDASDVGWKGTWVEGNEYGEGDKVEHNGQTWVSLEDGNSSTPRLIAT